MVNDITLLFLFALGILIAIFIHNITFSWINKRFKSDVKLTNVRTLIYWLVFGSPVLLSLYKFGLISGGKNILTMRQGIFWSGFNLIIGIFVLFVIIFKSYNCINLYPKKENTKKLKALLLFLSFFGLLNGVVILLYTYKKFGLGF